MYCRGIPNTVVILFERMSANQVMWNEPYAKDSLIVTMEQASLTVDTLSDGGILMNLILPEVDGRFSRIQASTIR